MVLKSGTKYQKLELIGWYNFELDEVMQRHIWMYGNIHHCSRTCGVCAWIDILNARDRWIQFVEGSNIVTVIGNH